MPRGSKTAYTSKQKRQAEHIEEGYKKKGVSSKTAAARAWATVNKEDGGGKKSGSGRVKKKTATAAKTPARKQVKKKATTRKAVTKESATKTKKK